MNTGTPRRLLVLTYEFPPTGGGGVQRVAKFCKFLRDHGWEPAIVTAEHVSGRPTDESLLDDVAGLTVVRLPHRNLIHRVARPLAAVKGVVRRSGREQGRATGAGVATARIPLSTRIVRWAAVPDEAVLWSRSVLPYLRASGQSYDAVFATGPPHSTLLAGHRCATYLGAPLIADMRDSWSLNPHFHFATPLHRAWIRRLQRRVCRAAACVTAVSQQIADEAAEFGASRSVVIPNGFDAADMPMRSADPTTSLTLAFMGRFYGLTDPAPLLAALADVLSGPRPRHVRLEVIGEAGPSIEAAVRARGLTGAVTLRGYLPHREALAAVAAADVGVVVIADEPGAESVYTGKLFEYLGMHMPILLLGPTEGAAAGVVRSSKAGVVTGYRDTAGIAQAINDMDDAKARGEALATPDAHYIAQFERSAQAARLAGLLDEVTAGDR